MSTVSRVLVFAIAATFAACGGASLVQTDCTDGQDNDGDGFIDDADPGCPFNNGQLETPDPAQCNDGIDNDGDGRIDTLDYGCETSTDDEELDPTRACNDGVDNDGDGKADAVPVDISSPPDGILEPIDPGCETPVDDDEYNPFMCNNLMDDDLDGLMDYPFDPGCASADDDVEGDDDCSEPEPPAHTMCPQCGDGIDNDLDGAVDVLDPGCTHAGDTDEFNVIPGACGPSVTVTDISATGDGMGTIDGPLVNGLTSPVCNGYGGEFAFTYTVTSGPVSLLVSTDHPETTLDTVVYVRTVCQNPATELACDDDGGTGHTSTAIVPLADIGTYYIIVDAFGPGSLGDFHVTVEERTALHGSCDPTDPAPCVPGLICRSFLPGDPTTCEYHICGDAYDNDGDGISDFPYEAGCTSLLDDTEDDTCPAGPGCPECGNGLDDDGDGIIDFAGSDPGCEYAADGLELDECYPGKPISALDPVLGVTGTTVGETNDASGSCGGTDSPESVYALTVDVPLESITFDTDNTTTGFFDTILYVREGTCDSTSAQVACNDNISSFNTHSSVTFTPTLGETYFVFVDAMWGSTGSFHIDVSGVILPGGVCDPGIPTFACTTGYACQDPGTGFVCLVADCDNATDDDSDGLIDWPNDPGCLTASDNIESDDDCSSPSPTACPICANNVDDDLDGFIDFDGGDIGCTAASDPDEIDECYPGSPVVMLDPDTGVTGNTAGAPMMSGGSCGGSDSPELIYALRVNVPLTSLTLDTDNATTGFFDTVLYVREDVCDVGLEVACNDDISPSDQNSTVTFTPMTDHMYYIFVDAKWGATGAFHLDVAGIIAAGGECDPATTNFACVSGYACRESTPGAVDWSCRIAFCNDGVDNDVDGFVDYPADPGCATASDDAEDYPNPITACSNGVDDDGDGFTDWSGGDPGCTAAADNGEIDECVPGEIVFDHPGGVVSGDTSAGGPSALSSPSACDPGISTPTTPEDVWVFNNTNNLTNLRFSTAGSSFDTILYVRYNVCDVAGPASYCNNDTSGTFTSQVDVPAPAMGYYFAVVDGQWSAVGPYTLSITGTVAVGGTCVAGDTNFPCTVGSACVGGTCVPAACNDGTDNDGDGDVDYPFDAGCTSVSDADETDPAILPQCGDGIDNDLDGDIDYPADDSCGAASDDNEACTSFGTDTYGYSGCTDTIGAVPPCEDISATGTLGPTGDDSSVTVTLPFSFDFYGVPQTTASLISNGKVGFLGTTSYSNTCTIESNTIAAYWDDLYPPSGGSVRWQTFGTSPNRHVTFQWNVPHIAGGTFYDIRAVIYETTNDIDVCYVDTETLSSFYDFGASATIGIQGSSSGLNYSCNLPNVPSGTLIRYNHP
jgi:large repetitive protein